MKQVILSFVTFLMLFQFEPYAEAHTSYYGEELRYKQCLRTIQIGMIHEKETTGKFGALDSKYLDEYGQTSYTIEVIKSGKKVRQWGESIRPILVLLFLISLGLFLLRKYKIILIPVALALLLLSPMLWFTVSSGERGLEYLNELDFTSPEKLNDGSSDILFRERPAKVFENQNIFIARTDGTFVKEPYKDHYPNP